MPIVGAPPKETEPMPVKITPKTPALKLSVIVQRIKDRTTAYEIETGKDLIEAKALVGHGGWGPWLKVNFGWSERTAQNLMNAAKLVAKNETLAVLKSTAIMALASKSVPESVKSEVIADIKAGKKTSPKEVKARIAAAKAKTAQPKPTTPAKRVNQPAPIKSGIMPPVDMDEDAELRGQLLDRGPEASFKLFEEVFGGKLTWAQAHEQVAA